MLVAAVVLGLSEAALAAGRVETFKVVSALPSEHVAVTIFRDHFRTAVETHMAAADDGVTVTWRSGYNGSIARHGAVLEAVDDGVGDIGIIAIDYENRQLPVQDIGYRLPFAANKCTTAAAAYHALHTDMAEMNRPWRQAGQIYLANITTDGFGLFTDKKIRSVEDLRGVMVGVSMRIEDWLTGVAAKPLRIPLSRLRGELEADMINGVILPSTEVARLGFARRLPNYLMTGFGPQTAYAITINEDAFFSLPPHLRDALLAAADEFVPAGAAAYCAAGARARETLKNEGVREQVFYRSRREAWVTALPPLGQQWATAREAEGYPGREILSAYMTRIREAGANPLRDWDLEVAATN